MSKGDKFHVEHVEERLEFDVFGRDFRKTNYYWCVAMM